MSVNLRESLIVITVVWQLSFINRLLSYRVKLSVLYSVPYILSEIQRIPLTVVCITVVPWSAFVDRGHSLGAGSNYCQVFFVSSSVSRQKPTKPKLDSLLQQFSSAIGMDRTVAESVIPIVSKSIYLFVRTTSQYPTYCDLLSSATTLSRRSNLEFWISSQGTKESYWQVSVTSDSGGMDLLIVVPNFAPPLYDGIASHTYVASISHAERPAFVLEPGECCYAYLRTEIMKTANMLKALRST